MTPLLDPYLSPQVQSAMIAGAFLALGWWVVAFQNRRRDAMLRREKVMDLQRALLAEIRAHVVALERQVEAGAFEVPEEISGDDHLPILPHDANDRVFRAILPEVHVLPGWAIDPVVRYYRLLAVRAALAQDLREAVAVSPTRAARMLRHYLQLNAETLETGLDAMEVLTEGLRGGEAAIRRLMAQRGAVSTGYQDPRGR